MHHVVTFPLFQNIIFEDASLKYFKKEIKIQRLDLLVVVEMLKYTRLSKSAAMVNHIKSIEVIERLRILLGCKAPEIFWENLAKKDTKPSEGLTKEFSVKRKGWSEIWKEGKSSVVIILKFLKEKDVIKESRYRYQLEELKLFETWTKQEIIQNKNVMIETQMKSLAFFNTSSQVDLF